MDGTSSERFEVAFVGLDMLEQIAEEALKSKGVEGETDDIEKKIEQALQCPCVGTWTLMRLAVLAELLVFG